MVIGENGLVTEEDLVELNVDDIPVNALDDVDLFLPSEYQDEVFANLLLNAITQYHSCETERRSLRHQGEHAKAEQLGKQAAVYRSQAALIQYEHPKTKELYKELAELKVMETKRNRDRVIKE